LRLRLNFCTRSTYVIPKDAVSFGTRFYTKPRTTRRAAAIFPGATLNTALPTGGIVGARSACPIPKVTRGAATSDAAFTVITGDRRAHLALLLLLVPDAAVLQALPFVFSGADIRIGGR